MATRTYALPRTTSVIGLRHLRLPVLLLGMVLLVVCILWSITLGAADIHPQTVYDAVFRFDETDFQHLVIQTVRLPRVLIGVLIGAALAVAGAIMQGLTRNPLADSGILGIQSGAAFAVVLGVSLIPDLSMSDYAVFGFIGAAITATAVYALGSMGRGGTTPLKLTLSGVIVTAFISSFTTMLLIRNTATLETIRFWTAGSLAGRDMPLLARTAPYVFIGLAGALMIGREITTMSLGEDVAKGLGQDTLRIKLVAAFIVVLLAGSAVALAGPVGFVGLIVPHVVRMISGVDYRWIIPYSAVGGALLVTTADVGARLVIRPQDVPVGIIMAILGAPFFIALARWKVKR